MSHLQLLARLVRHLPNRVADSLTSRVLIPRQRDPALATYFERAPLVYAPGSAMKLSSTDFMHGMIAFSGAYERPLSELLCNQGRKGGLLVDIGANWGYFTLLWAAAKPGNRVIAVDASPRNISPLETNIEMNGFENVVQTHFLAAGREPGTLPFDLGPDGIFGWGGISLATSDTTVLVPVKKLDDICADAPVVDVLKIDVEGAELLVLQGAEQLLREKRVRQIVLELNDTRMKALGISRDGPQTLLVRHGYRCTERGDSLFAEPA